MESGEAVVEGIESQGDGSERELILSRDENLATEVEGEDTEVSAAFSGVYDCCMRMHQLINSTGGYIFTSVMLHGLCRIPLQYSILF